MSESKTTLVTGGAGFIGSHLCDALVARGERVVCIDNFNEFYNPAQKRANVAALLRHPGFTLIEGDIRDRDLLARAFEQHRPARVAHLAAMANVRYSIERAPLYVGVNIQGTINVLDAARSVGIENFVFASTSSVYGDTDQFPFVEEQSTDHPLAPYPATKKAAEVLGYSYHNMFGVNFTAVRFFTVYGPRVRPDMMAYTVMDDILHGREITLFNGGEMYRDWTYVGDIIKGVVAALDTPLGYAVLNLGRGEPVRLGDFVSVIERLTGAPAAVRAVPAPPSEPPRTFANVDKARRLLGYNPRVSVDEGLAHTWEWYCAFHQPNQ